MKFTATQLVTKISVSDVLVSKSFYENILGFQVDDRYTINVKSKKDKNKKHQKEFQKESYMQLNAPSNNGGAFTLGLFKDIKKPFKKVPKNGTVPSFIVDDIHATLHHFLEKHVVVEVAMEQATGDDKYIIENKSDEGYVDLFFFFCDPDNNSLVIRQNLPKLPA